MTLFIAVICSSAGNVGAAAEQEVRRLAHWRVWRKSCDGVDGEARDGMKALYDEWIKVDDLAIKAIELSLPEHAQEVVKRIHLDYAQDIGMVGLLRRMHVEAGFHAAAQLFWASRREPSSPRLETVLAQLLLNIAASTIYDVIKDLARDPDQVDAFIDARGIAASALQAGGLDLATAWAHLRSVWQLHRWRSNDCVKPVQAFITQVLGGTEVSISIDGSTAAEVETVRRNLLYAVRGLVVQEIEHSGEILLPANGRTVLGVAASDGLGFGAPIAWPAASRLKPAGEFVLMVPQIGGALPNALTDLLNRCQAAISVDQSSVGHIPVYCRAIGKPLVLLGERQIGSIQKHGFVVVDGTAGRIKLFIERAASGI